MSAEKDASDAPDASETASAQDGARADPGETGGWRDAVGWAAVGTLSYLVLLQGYELWSGVRVDLLVKAGTTVAVAVLALATTTVLARRLAG